MNRWLHLLAAYALLPALVTLTSLEVFFRYALSSPLQWTEEVVSLLLLMSFVAPWLWGAQQGAHVRVETLAEHFGPRLQAVSSRLSALCAAVFFALLALGAGREAHGLLQRGDRSDVAGIVQWPFAGFVAVLAAYAALWFAWRVLRGLPEAHRPDVP
ncbi:MAG TPA: TRAP transporter small permease [Ramlibacter sp.]|nr:TRAP transporter small permease [Ramlibacter sp.]